LIGHAAAVLDDFPGELQRRPLLRFVVDIYRPFPMRRRETGSPYLRALRNTDSGLDRVCGLLVEGE
jgi:hypothetical protein